MWCNTTIRIPSRGRSARATASHRTSPGGYDVEWLVEFARCVIFRLGVADEPDAGVEGDDGLGIAALDGVGIDAGDAL